LSPCAGRLAFGAAWCGPVHESTVQAAAATATAMPSCRRADIQAYLPMGGTTLIPVAEPTMIKYTKLTRDGQSDGATGPAGLRQVSS